MKKVAEYLLITIGLLLLVSLVSVGGLANQMAVVKQGNQAQQQPVTDPNCPPLINDGKKFQHYNLQPCHGLQIIDITAQQSGDIQNDSGHDVRIRWNGELKDLPQNMVSTFLGPGRLEAPVQ